MISNTNNIQRVNLNYFDGVNTGVASNLSKKNELRSSVNARSKSIGSIEKREGSHRLGDSIVGLANYGIFYFENGTTKGFYRITKVGSTTSIYYLSDLAAWTALTIHGTNLTATQFSHAMAEGYCFLVNGTDNNRYIDDNGTTVKTSADFGGATTRFDITHSGFTFTYTYDGTGTNPNISTSTMRTGDIINITASGFVAGNRGSFTVTDVGTNYFKVANISGQDENDVTITTGSIRINNHLTGSLKAYKINYYKDRLYLGDYTAVSSGNRYKNGIIMSSPQLGIVALVDGDATLPITSLKVTDLKYIHSDDILDVYRGGSKVGVLLVTAKNSTANTLTATITYEAGFSSVLSSDEVWVAGTYSNKRIFRWAVNDSGIDVKQYDSFRLSGGQNDAITMMTNIGDVMLIANKHNIAVWNNSNLQNFDLGIGNVSNNGWVKNMGNLFFIHYTGIYSTAGGLPRLISSKIQNYINGASKAGLEAGAMGKKGSSIFCSIGDVTLYHPDGSIKKTLTDVCLEYNLIQNSWFVHDGISATAFATYFSSDDTDRLEYADDGTNCDIREFLRSGSAVDDEDVTNKEILFEMETNGIPFNKSFEKVVFPLEIILEAERGHSLQCFVKLDNGQPYSLDGEIVKGCSILKIKGKDANNTAPVRCRNLSVILKDFSKSLCKITRMAVTFLPSSEEDESSPTNFGK